MFSVNDGRIDRRTQWIIETASLFMKKMNFYGRIIVCTWRWYLYNMVAQNMLRTYAGKKCFRIKKYPICDYTLGRIKCLKQIK